MIISGNLTKMRSEPGNPVRYFLPLGNSEIEMNSLLGKEIQLKHNGVINCVNCSKRTSKSYGQGFCYNCFLTAPEADESVFRPELSKAHLRIARDMQWSIENDLIDHYVYLSITNDLKVGVTRHHQLFTRWIDQGAVKTIKLAKTPNRHIAGIIEVFLKQYVADKTQWNKMLRGEIKEGIDLKTEKERLIQLLPAELKQYAEPDQTIFEFTYPGISVPEKIHSMGFDDTPEISGELLAIKGQYILFKDGGALNIRKYSGYFVELAINS
ncbi:MAG TPA: DUF2797 domain-containing protein [Prolixibacteraceae bacterium]|nr:DUF2797 domain-containing protein [Prolixibacteraceae bacterium]